LEPLNFSVFANQSLPPSSTSRRPGNKTGRHRRRISLPTGLPRHWFRPPPTFLLLLAPLPSPCWPFLPSPRRAAKPAPVSSSPACAPPREAALSSLLALHCLYASHIEHRHHPNGLFAGAPSPCHAAREPSSRTTSPAPMERPTPAPIHPSFLSNLILRPSWYSSSPHFGYK
jgi:hypothetical protein